MSAVVTSYKVARCYAEALVQVLDAEGVAIGFFMQQSGGLLQLLSHAEVQALWRSPEHPLAQKKQLAHAVVSEVLQGVVADVLGGFLQVMLEANRMDLLSGVCEVLRRLDDERKGVKRGALVLAEKASSAQLSELQSVVDEVFESQVQLEVQVDPQLLAGFVLRVGYLRYDGSLRSHLKELQWFLRS